MNKLFFGLLLQVAFYSGSLYAQADLRTDAYSIIQDAVTDIVCSSSTDAIQKEKRVIQVLNEKGKEKVKKMFPGYILVEMVMTDEAWFIVRNTPGVTGFIGSSGKGAKPFPLTPAEVDKILGSMGMSRLEIGNSLNVDDMVKVINGPFANMYGKIKSINMENQQLEVALDLFGQETIVELNLTEIEKA